MQIEAVELLRLDLTLRHSLATSAGSHAARPLILVVIHAEEVTGYGECEALEAPTYTEEYADGAEAVLLEHLLPRLFAGGPLSTTEEAMTRFVPVRGHQMAKAALEMALLDAELKLAGRSLGNYLGATRHSIPAGANVSLGAPEAVLRDVAEVVEAGYERVKCKIAPGHDLDTLIAVREAFPEVVLTADANGAYDLSEPTQRAHLHRIDELGLAALEQPLAAEDLLGLARLCDELETPVVLDESVTGLTSLELALFLGAGDAVSVKPARLGGLLIAKAVHDRCVAAGIGLCVGGMLESGLGRAAALAIGALPGFSLPGDLGGSERYFDPDLTAPHVLVDGALALPAGPGLGVEPIAEVVDGALARRTLLKAP